MIHPLTTILHLCGLSTAIVLFLGFCPLPAEGSSDQTVTALETEVQTRPCREEVTDSVIECLAQETLCKEASGKLSCKVAQSACQQAKRAEDSCLRQVSLDQI